MLLHPLLNKQKARTRVLSKKTQFWRLWPMVLSGAPPLSDLVEFIDSGKVYTPFQAQWCKLHVHPLETWSLQTGLQCLYFRTLPLFVFIPQGHSPNGFMTGYICLPVCSGYNYVCLSALDIIICLSVCLSALDVSVTLPVCRTGEIMCLSPSFSSGYIYIYIYIYICEQVLFVYVYTIIPPRLSDPCNFITVLLVTREPEQTTLLF